MHRPVALANALADPTRWRIASLVASRTLCVCELADILDLPQSTLSTHLQVMRKATLVVAERCEKFAYYRLAPEVLPLFKALDRLAEKDPLLAGDQKRATARLAIRGQTNCKGPRRSIPPAKKTKRP